MIKANEIRTGNIYHFPFHDENVTVIGYGKRESDGEFRVQFETKGGILFESLSALQPIPLTPEILEKCGFEKVEKLWGIIYERDRIRFSQDLNICKQKGLTIENRITSLHQLQNLFFVLTGEDIPEAG